MKKFTRIDIELLGQRFTLTSEAPPEYVHRLVAHVDRTVKELAAEETQDPVKRTILAALYIADELFRAREAQSQEAEDAAKRVGVLIQLLDIVAPPAPLSS
ncbi:MAG: cell division protein ZapA [Candidatus Methylomirabilia bacterium]